LSKNQSTKGSGSEVVNICKGERKWAQRLRKEEMIGPDRGRDRDRSGKELTVIQKIERNDVPSIPGKRMNGGATFNPTE
jgi:hypothetical protein